MGQKNCVVKSIISPMFVLIMIFAMRLQVPAVAPGNVRQIDGGNTLHLSGLQGIRKVT